MTNISWVQLKQLIKLDNLPYTWTKDDNSYTITTFNGPASFQAIISTTDPIGPDQLDFETNFKNASSQKIPTVVDSSPPFGAKTIMVNGVIKKLYARFTGQQYTITTGSNTLDFTMPFPWAKIVGLEIIGGEKLDYTDLKIYDTAGGTYSGYPNVMLNQFAFTMNVAPDFYQKMAQFDADVYQGMILRFTYTSISDKIIGINFLINEVKS